MMNPQNQGTGSSIAHPPLKRKRGRPRKDENLTQRENTPSMPGSDSMGKNKPIGNASAAVSGEMVGQLVTGVIEGTFDGGYLLKVKVGDSDTHLRGVVFLPGRFMPVTTTNDIAPQAKMYHRTDMPIPAPNLPTQLPASFPLQSTKQAFEPKSLAPTILDQRLSSVPQSATPLVLDGAPPSGMLPTRSTGSPLGDKVVPYQILESGLENQSAPVVPQMGHAKVAEQDKLLQEFEASIIRGPVMNVEITEQSKSKPLPSSSIDVFPGTEIVKPKLQPQTASHGLELTQQVPDVASPSLKHNQTPVITEPGITSFRNTLTEKEVSPQKAAPPDLGMNFFGEDAPAELNGRPANRAASITGVHLLSAPVTRLPTALFESDAVPSASKVATEACSQQTKNAHQSCVSSGATNDMRADWDSTPMNSLPITLLERDATPSESRAAADGPLLPRMAEP